MLEKLKEEIYAAILKFLSKIHYDLYIGKCQRY